MKSDEFHRWVVRNGWVYVRKAGSHVIYRKGGRTYPVPYHGAKEMGTGLVRKISKEMGLKQLIMKQIAATIERAADGTYSVYCKKEIFSGMGASIEEAKADMLKQMEVYKATAREEGFRYPEFLDGDYSITYTVDARSLMEFYLGKGWFTLATLEKLTGISQKQLWAYAHGTKPRKRQEDRIRAGLYNISKDLDAIFA